MRLIALLLFDLDVTTTTISEDIARRSPTLIPHAPEM